jgi:hypothetical protein
LDARDTAAPVWALTPRDAAIASADVIVRAACAAVAAGKQTWAVTTQTPAERLAVGALLGASLARTLDARKGIYELFTASICEAWRPATAAAVESARISGYTDLDAPDVTLAAIRAAVPVFANAKDVPLCALAFFVSETLGASVDVRDPDEPKFAWAVVEMLRDALAVVEAMEQGGVEEVEG